MNRKASRSGLFFDSAFFILSSPDDRFIKSFAESLLQELSFGDECWFKTLSLIYIKTMRKENEVLQEIDLYPTEPKFYENLHKNLVERFNEFYDKAPVDHFDVNETADIKSKRIKISDGYRRCSLFSMQLQASPELLKFAYDAGFGEKNAMGYGCVDAMD